MKDEFVAKCTSSPRPLFTHENIRAKESERERGTMDTLEIHDIYICNDSAGDEISHELEKWAKAERNNRT